MLSQEYARNPYPSQSERTQLSQTLNASILHVDVSVLKSFLNHVIELNFNLTIRDGSKDVDAELVKLGCCAVNPM